MAHPISEFVVKYFNWVFLALLALNLFQRRYGAKARKKRFATLYIAIAVFLFFTLANSLVSFKLPEWLLLGYVPVIGIAGWFLRDHIFPFRFKCSACSATLNFDQFIFNDANLCTDCAAKAEPKPAEPEAEESDDEKQAESQS
ncbi:MAG TPA: hypothetical protein VMW73_17470 [Spirochaetia bacterium]|nr:hypothetical protein [Spirochaetia bacterium]